MAFTLSNDAFSIACHTAREGKTFAGGLPMKTPFGTLYTSNITPDPQTGIGMWTSDQFYQMMHNGRFPDGGLNDGFVAELRSHDVPEDAPVVFLCRSGARSVGAARAATAAGFARSFNVLEGFEGGLDERGHRGGTGWRARGLPWRQS